jgi:hypothetical protein
VIDIALLVLYLVRPKTARNNTAFTNANNVEFIQQTSHPIRFFSSRLPHFVLIRKICVLYTKEGVILMH